MSGPFDYEDARRDLEDNGIDPDLLDEYNEERRDRFLRKNGLHPEDYGGSSDHGDHGSSSDPCYLTCACTYARGLPDDCAELTALRAFRDGYLRSAPGGEADVAEYYASAPSIVEAVNERSDASAIWNTVYEALILPCIDLIRRGENEAAREKYKAYTLALREKYCKGEN